MMRDASGNRRVLRPRENNIRPPAEVPVGNHLSAKRPLSGPELVGRSVRRKFGSEYWVGVISSCNSRWWHVKYPDGDEEDLDARQVQAGLVAEKAPRIVQVALVADQEMHHALLAKSIRQEENATREILDQPAAVGSLVKVEPYTGSYDCLICEESVRRCSHVLKCSQCEANPYHRECAGEWATRCPQCKATAVLPWNLSAGQVNADLQSSAIIVNVDHIEQAIKLQAAVRGWLIRYPRKRVLLRIESIMSIVTNFDTFSSVEDTNFDGVPMAIVRYSQVLVQQMAKLQAVQMPWSLSVVKKQQQAVSEVQARLNSVDVCLAKSLAAKGSAEAEAATSAAGAFRHFRQGLSLDILEYDDIFGEYPDFESVKEVIDTEIRPLCSYVKSIFAIMGNVQDSSQPDIQDHVQGLTHDQLQGAQHLRRSFENGVGAVIVRQQVSERATQAAAFFAFLHSQNIKGPFLVFTQTSQLSCWTRAFNCWCPNVPLQCYQGPQSDRFLLRSRWPWSGIILSSYEFVREDLKYFLNFGPARHKFYIKAGFRPMLLLDAADELLKVDSLIFDTIQACIHDIPRDITVSLLMGRPLPHDTVGTWRLLHLLRQALGSFTSPLLPRRRLINRDPIRPFWSSSPISFRLQQLIPTIVPDEFHEFEQEYGNKVMNENADKILMACRLFEGPTEDRVPQTDSQEKDVQPRNTPPKRKTRISKTAGDPFQWPITFQQRMSIDNKAANVATFAELSGTWDVYAYFCQNEMLEASDRKNLLLEV